MSLIRQIGLLLLGTLLAAFASGVVVTTVAARNTLQTQLHLKNNDNAAVLALALSQQKGDAEVAALIMSAQFDTGFYRQIRLLGPDGRILFTRDAKLAPVHAPGWFVTLLPIELAPGRAQVSDGWRALGTVQVISHSAYAHDELWHSSVLSAAALAAVGLLAALVARAVVGRLRGALQKVVEQAHSLVNGHFVTTPEPHVPELRRLTRAMNGMVRRLKQMFEAQTAQLESLRQQVNCDALTGLANRTHFMALLDAQLQREDGPCEGGLVLLRMLDLASLNRQLGHVAVDRALSAVAQTLHTYAERVPGCALGRLNGCDFAICLPVGGVARETAQALSDGLQHVMASFGSGIGLVVGAVEMQRDRQVAAVLSAADVALARAESRGAYAVELGDGVAAGPPLGGERTWREQIHSAVVQHRLRLVRFPLIDAQGELIHLECPLRLQLDANGPFDTAARWLPLALRSRLTALVDERAVALALADIGFDSRPRCINLARASLAESGFIARLRALVLAQSHAAQRLWLEVPEAVAGEHVEWLQELGRQLRPLGVRIGIEHAGEQLTRLEHLFEAGIDYVKLDASVLHGVAHDTDRAGYVKAVTRMLHSLSFQVYGEGVADEDDAVALHTLGLDGLTGPWASARRPDLVD